ERNIADLLFLQEPPCSGCTAGLGGAQARSCNIRSLERAAVDENITANHKGHRRKEDGCESEDHRSTASAKRSLEISTPATRRRSMNWGRTPVVSKSPMTWPSGVI